MFLDLTIDICGCTDPTAFNYDVDATADDGSCIATVFGCLDSLANNYNALANTENGSCIYEVFGCIDESACNYNSQANSEDGSCHYPDTSFTQVIACDSYEWNGQTYTESGAYTNIYTNNNGCDSVVVLNLTINETLSIEDDAMTSCNGENISIEINNQNEWRWVTLEDTSIMYWGNGYPTSSSLCGAVLETDGFYNPNCNSNLPFVLEFDESSDPQNLTLGESLSGFELAVACNSGAPNSTK